MPTTRECKITPEHQAHMAVNGECPWCGEYDETQGGMSVDDAVTMWG